MNHIAAACLVNRSAAPHRRLAAACTAMAAGFLLLQAGAPAVAASDPVLAEAATERISEAPWKLARRPLQQPVLRLELQNPAPAPRPALDFQRASKSSGMPVGQLRMSLSDTASLSFRPRSGGLNVTYRERF